MGYKKYGQTLDNERKTGVKDLAAYLNDVQEELMDAILYIQSARESLENKSQSKLSTAQLDFNDKNTGLPYYVTDVAS